VGWIEPHRQPARIVTELRNELEDIRRLLLGREVKRRHGDADLLAATQEDDVQLILEAGLGRHSEGVSIVLDSTPDFVRPALGLHARNLRALPMTPRDPARLAAMRPSAAIGGCAR